MSLPLSGKSKADALSDKVIRALLERHACPLPFHAVRALFMGNIATPDMTASPMQTIRDLWGGELPEFETQEDAEIFADRLDAGALERIEQSSKAYQPIQVDAGED